MAKNYATIYNSGNDSTAPNQKFYAVQEVTRGTIVAPTVNDFFFTLSGGSIDYSQAIESSQHRSDRHHTSIIKKKKETSWSFSTYFNIDELAPQGASEIDTAIRLLWKSLLGRETIPGGLQYDAATDPNVTFTLYEVGDHWARVSPACWVDSGNVQLPGDGEATVEWSGMGATTYYIGIGQSDQDNNGGNTITFTNISEARRFPIGAPVMLLANDGVTRVDGTGVAHRIVTAVDTVAGTITVSGAALAAFDGSVTPVYVAYFEPDTSALVAINNPITGLVGSIALDTLSVSCVRTASINIQNNHEAVNYCFGSDALKAPYFVPADRLTVEVSVELNLNANLIEFLRRVENFESHDIDIDLGDSGGRHFHLDLPNVIFSVPTYAVPDSGSIPVSFTGNAYQSAIGAADEITASFL